MIDAAVGDRRHGLPAKHRLWKWKGVFVPLMKKAFVGMLVVFTGLCACQEPGRVNPAPSLVSPGSTGQQHPQYGQPESSGLSQPSFDPALEYPRAEYDAVAGIYEVDAIYEFCEAVQENRDSSVVFHDRDSSDQEGGGTYRFVYQDGALSGGFWDSSGAHRYEIHPFDHAFVTDSGFFVVGDFLFARIEPLPEECVRAAETYIRPICAYIYGVLGNWDGHADIHSVQWNWVYYGLFSKKKNLRFYDYENHERLEVRIPREEYEADILQYFDVDVQLLRGTAQDTREEALYDAQTDTYRVSPWEGGGFSYEEVWDITENADGTTDLHWVRLSPISPGGYSFTVTYDDEGRPTAVPMFRGVLTIRILEDGSFRYVRCSAEDPST